MNDPTETNPNLPEHDRADSIDTAAAELGSYAASMVVAAAHAEPMASTAGELLSLVAGSGRAGDTSARDMSATFTGLAADAHTRLFAMVRNGQTDIQLGGAYDRSAMYRRLQAIRAKLAELDASVLAVAGEFGPYVPETE